MHRRSVPRPLLLLSVATFIAGAVAFIVSWKLQPPYFSYPLLILALATLLTENFALTIPGGSISLAYPLTVAAIVLQGPASGGLVAALSSVTVQDVKRRFPLAVVGFNVGQLLLITAAGGWTYELLGGSPILGPAAPHLVVSSVPRALFAIAVTGIVCGAGNVLLTSVGMWAARGGRVRHYVAENAWAIPSQLALAFVGYLIALVLSMSVVGFLLFVFPLAVARQLYVNYLHTREAYVDTVRSLVGAVEAKDLYTRGHSERVAELALRVGESLGLGGPEMRRLEYAALLHDVGKLGISQVVLSKPGKLTESEYGEVKRHSEYGAALVERISTLKELAGPIRHHHERIDGAGYPDGLVGEGIPFLARILCVADSYDAMTSARSYRPAMSCTDAAAELVRCSETQFDPQVVSAFLSDVLQEESARLFSEPSGAPSVAPAEPVT